MSLSDLFCVERHKDFLDLVQNKLNITFANEQEIIALIEAKILKKLLILQKNKKINSYNTRRKGCYAFQNDQVVECNAKKNLKIKIYWCRGFICSRFFTWTCKQIIFKRKLRKGTEISSKVIQQVGARL